MRAIRRPAADARPRGRRARRPVRWQTDAEQPATYNRLSSIHSVTAMSKPTAPLPVPTAARAALAAQKAAFTAEGSPPPGKVATEKPLEPTPRGPVAAGKANARGTARTQPDVKPLP